MLFLSLEFSAEWVWDLALAFRLWAILAGCSNYWIIWACTCFSVASYYSV